MTESESQDEQNPSEHGEEDASQNTEEDSPSKMNEEESSGDAALDELLSEGILKGYARLDLAQICMAMFMIAALGWIAFSATSTSGFLHADQLAIVQNDALHQLATASSAVTETMSLTTALSFAMNWVIGNGDAWAFQYTQIAIHLLNALLVFLLCRLLMRNEESEAIAMVAGLLFAMHPSSTYLVNTLLNRDMLLGTCFMLSSLTLFCSAIQSETRSWIRITLSMVCIALAWSCTAWTWIIPVLLVLLTAGILGWTGVRQQIAPLGLSFAVAGLLLIPETLTLDAADTGRVSMVYALRDAHHLPDYITAWFAPGQESWRYLPESEFSGIPVVLAGLLIVGCIALIKFPRIGLLLLWPACLVLATGTGVLTDTFDNSYIYPATVAVAWFLPLLISSLSVAKVRVVGGLLAFASILVCFGMTHTRNVDWKDEIYFWSRANEECPTCFEPIVRLAQVYEGEGNRLVESETAETIDPGKLELARNNWENAEGFYAIAEAAGGDFRPYLRDYAIVQRRQGKVEEAIGTLEKLLARQPENEEILRLLALWHNDRYQEFRDVVDIRSAIDYFSALERLGSLIDSDKLIWSNNLLMIGATSLASVPLRTIQDAQILEQAQPLLEQLEPRIEMIANQRRAIRENARNGPLDEVMRMQVNLFMLENQSKKARYLNEELVRLLNNTSIEDWFLLSFSYHALNEWDIFVRYWNPPSDISRPWSQLGQYAASRNQWGVALSSLIERPGYSTDDARPEALLALADLAMQQQNRPQAASLYRQMAQQHPDRFEPLLRLADLAIQDNQNEVVRGLLQQAESRGAPQDEVELLRDRAGMKSSPLDLLKPTIIQ
jgi:tetratricopeptide (TPR) repeat protein